MLLNRKMYQNVGIFACSHVFFSDAMDYQPKVYIFYEVMVRILLYEQ